MLQVETLPDKTFITFGFCLYVNISDNLSSLSLIGKALMVLQYPHLSTSDKNALSNGLLAMLKDSEQEIKDFGKAVVSNQLIILL